MKTLTATEAKNSFGMLLDWARQEPVLIEKQGRQVAVMLSVEEYQRLSNPQKLLSNLGDKDLTLAERLAILKLPLKLIAPITDWKNYFSQNPWHVQIIHNSTNNLTKISAVDTIQLRGVDFQRFQKKIGIISEEEMQKILISIITVIDIDLNTFFS